MFSFHVFTFSPLLAINNNSVSLLLLSLCQRPSDNDVTFCLSNKGSARLVSPFHQQRDPRSGRAGDVCCGVTRRIVTCEQQRQQHDTLQWRSRDKQPCRGTARVVSSLSGRGYCVGWVHVPGLVLGYLTVLLHMKESLLTSDAASLTTPGKAIRTIRNKEIR